MKYDLEHLTQNDSQRVLGPIQDDEALFLYSIIVGMKIKNVFEIGGRQGYSARNFLKAVGINGKVFTCDINRCPKISENHYVIHKNAINIIPEDIENNIIELIFLDCHNYEVQTKVLDNLINLNLINDETVIAVHDTNLHPFKTVSWAYPISKGYVHQPVERRIVNDLVKKGYHAFSLHTTMDKHSDSFPFRHGVTVLKKFIELEV